LIAFSWTGDVMGYVWAIVALGMVIFVHELGHFVVAKLAGVKCDKFYLGFDIGGLKLLKFTWGETEYGIGILPLGGYVKMLGQEDNPARLREEMERARVPSGDGAAATAETSVASSLPPAPSYDPRSYLAKSVPVRMAIISAGVIMNVIFAFVIAAVAYWIGVKHVACGVGEVVAGGPAWKADLRAGDEILKINDEPVTRFMEVQAKISLGNNLEKGVRIEVRRPSEPQRAPFTVTVMPTLRRLPSIGVLSPRDTTLYSEGQPVIPATAAAEAQPALKSADRIVEIDGRRVTQAGDIEVAQALNTDKNLQLTVLRAQGPEKSAAEQKIAVTVPPRPMRTVGLVMNMGEITGVQAGSPAEKAGVQPGDQILQIDGRDPGDPLTLSERLPPAGDVATLTVSRKGAKEPLKLEVTLRRDDRIETPILPKSSVSAPALGIAYRVLNRVQAVDEGSPADKAGVRPGEMLTGTELSPPEKLPAGMERKPGVFKVSFSDEERNWPYFFHLMQDALPGSTVQLTFDNKHTVTLEPVAAKNWFNPDRGFLLDPKLVNQRATSLTEALRLGYAETLDATTMVFGVLGKLGTQISPRELSGPVGILNMASRAAQEGLTRLLLFLCMISANLAVINFLPIPLLDGGHMVFLAYEGIRGRPASERVQLVLTYIGLVFLLTLMVWVLGLDFNLISRD
jgi:regulator of sigma E protease